MLIFVKSVALLEGGRQLVACDKHIATIVEGQRADPVQLLLVLSNDLGRGRRFAKLVCSSGTQIPKCSGMCSGKQSALTKLLTDCTLKSVC